MLQEEFNRVEHFLKISEDAIESLLQRKREVRAELDQLDETLMMEFIGENKVTDEKLNEICDKVFQLSSKEIAVTFLLETVKEVKHDLIKRRAFLNMVMCN